MPVKATIKKAETLIERDSDHTAYVANKYPSTRIFGDMYIVNAPYRSQDIAKWKRALDAARNSYNPRRDALQDLYLDIALDTQVTTVINKRTIGVTNKLVKYILEDGTEDPDMRSMVTSKRWFRDILKEHQNSIFFGPSVIEFLLDGGEVTGIETLPRDHVVPEMGVVLKQQGDSTGYSYLNDPTIVPYTMPIGEAEDFGLLLPLAVWVIYKRGGMNALTKFCELYGLPMRVGYYNGYDDKQRQKMASAFENQGANSYLVLPDGSKVEFIQPQGSQSGDAFKLNLEMCDAQISKAALGGTMTTDNGSSKSQGEVHERGEDDIILSDIRNIEYLLNEVLVEKLKGFGYPVKEGGRFVFDLSKEPNFAALGDFLSKVIPLGLEVPSAYVLKKLGIPAPKDGEATLKYIAPVISQPNNPGNKPDPNNPDTPPDSYRDDPKKPKAAQMHTAVLGSPVMQAVDKYYQQAHTCCGPAMAAEPELSDYDKIMERLIKAIHKGGNMVVDKALLEQTANDLLKALSTGFKDGVNVVGSDAALLAQLTDNIYNFSGAKTYQQLSDMRNLLVDADGNIRSFTDYKQAVLTNINPKYNQTYLAAEYNTTLSTATEAARWQNIVADKEALPYLRYSAVLDDQTRPEHAALDGTVKPVDDPFWDTYYPPIDWNCRCTIESIDADEAADAPATDPALYPEVKELFNNNAGKSGQVFTDAHPYFSGIDPKSQKAIDKAIDNIKADND